MKLKLPVLFFFLFCVFQIGISQSRWTNIYFEDQDAYGSCISSSYDMGYYLVIKDGRGSVNFNWLVKINVNGDILWQKLIGSPDFSTVYRDIKISTVGEVFLAGITNSVEQDNYDPFVMKLNSCGEKEWCKIFNSDGYNFAYKILALDNSESVVLLRQMSSVLSKDRVCLAKLTADGDFIWQECYNSADTLISNQAVYDLTLCPDQGFLITGNCGYTELSPPYLSYTKPYFLKTNSHGEFEWEKVVYSESESMGGQAWRTQIDPDSSYYFTTMSNFFYGVGDSPSLLKMDFMGNQIEIFDLFQPGDYGKMTNFGFIDDSLLVGSAVWGDGKIRHAKAVTFTKSGEVIDTCNLIENEEMSRVAISSDDKALFFTNIYNVAPDQWDAHLFKFNKHLIHDSIYNTSFNYDSLCPSSIESDTVYIDDCSIIVDIEDIEKESPENEFIVYPNPASEQITVVMNNYHGTELRITNINGQLVYQENKPIQENSIQISVRNWQKGIYIVQVRTSEGALKCRKLIVR